MEEELIAPCGMNCSLCSAYQAMKNDSKSQGIKTPYCIGCRPRNKQCAYIYKQCALLRNKKITYCYECRDFPCHNLQTIDERYKKRYRMSMIENLQSIKKNGIEKFLKDQKEKWQCPTCNGLICTHNGLCFKCDITKLKHKKKIYSWDNC